MSSRGGGDRGQGQWQQQSASSGRWGGGGGRRGGGLAGQGRGDGSSGGRARGWAVHSAPTPSQSFSSSSLSSEVDRKLTLQPPASAWARPSSSTQPQAVQPPAVQQQPLQPQQQLVSPVMSSKAIRPPVRPGYGKLGQKCIVRANHFLVQVADRDLHHYDVTISPEVTNKKKCREIIAKLEDNYKDSVLGNRKLAYDGRKSAYTGGPLPFNSKEFVINLMDSDGNGRERQFKVTIKFAGKVDLDHLQQFLRGKQLDVPQETIQALDVALRAMPSSIYEVVGRSFFYPDLGNCGNLGNGVEYWTGFYQSLRPTQMGLSLNIDMSARGFYEPIMVSDFVARYLGREVTRPLSDKDRVKLRKALRGVKIELNHQGYRRCCKISGLSIQPTQHITFIDETGSEKSVVQYFQEKYGKRLRFTSLPALQSGSDARPVYLPMEVSKIVPGQRYSRKLNKDQVVKLLKANCQRPDAREGSISKMVRDNNYNANELVSKEFGIKVLPELTSVEARVLPPPMLKYHGTGRGSLVEPRVGQWNMKDKKLINGAKVEFWTCVSFAKSNLDVAKFCNDLINVCCNKGMEFHRTPLLPISYANPAQIEKVLSDIHMHASRKISSMEQHRKELQLLIVVLPEGTGYHGRIKKKCEIDLGIISQCVLAKQALKNPMSYLDNLALKINVKAGGRNSVLERAIQRNIPYLTERPTIIFGADVTHPSPGEDSSPSIAAVVASMDFPEVTKYKALVSAQPCREEIIHDLGALVRELLLGFSRSSRVRPDRIIFYRDGVSEGQFNEVLLREMDAIRQACDNLEKNYQPRVTFIVVQKRHHTRLFPGDRNTADRSGNILPGTVVDSTICHPNEFDFYLCSHAGIQGTSRPTHYHVLYDENNFTADGLQMLTNSLCYTYARCTRSVSIVPPAYYAHLAAFRAREYAEGEFSESGSTSEGRSTRDKRDFQPLPPIKNNVKEFMFYC